MSAPELFSLLGPLPTSGRVAVEASAGTGKTYTLAGLVVRYVAETDVPVEELLTVTFTRAAAAELRDRVRTRLSEAAAGLRHPEDIPAGDDLLSFLAGTDRARRLDRLEQAVVDFDAATITTIHGFAQQVRATLGSTSHIDLDASLLEDTGDLVRAVCADVLAAESVASPGTADDLPTLEKLPGLCLKVLGNPGIRVIPGTEDDESTVPAARLRRLVDRVVAEVHRRRRAAGTLSFDDLLTQLRDGLDNPAAVAAVHRRFRIALIDEFQDTDPVQWAIFSRLFGNPGDGTALVLVADPKQAIYSFRGADVHTYLEAAREPTKRFTLGVNWRSDGALLAGLGALFRGTTFGDAGIEFVEVAPSEVNRDRRLTADDGTALPALRVRLVIGEDLRRSKKGWVYAPDADAAIARDLAHQVQHLLETALIPSGDPAPPRRARPSDVAVLIGKRAEAEPIKTALRCRGIPAVVTRGDSVLRSRAADQWRWLLTALARPNEPTRARTAALSWFFGWSVAELDAADDVDLGEVQDQLFRWARTLEAHGVVELCAQVWSESGVTARVLATSDGDRDLTDLDHIAGLLQAGTAGRRATAAGLLMTLAQLAVEVAEDPDNDVSARQIESEAEAVQIMTVHVAKGLEFPVVCVPTLWRKSYATTNEVVFRDRDTRRRTFDVTNGQPWPTKAAAKKRKALANEEALGENQRLLYVALTRAEHVTLVWWSPVEGADLTGLARVLFARSEGVICPEKFSAGTVELPSDADAPGQLAAVFAQCGDAVAIGVAGAGSVPDGRWADGAKAIAHGVLALAKLERKLARTSRRWSFSAISDRGRDAVLDPEDESLGDGGAADEPFEAVDPVAQGDTPGSSDLPLGAISGGAGFGTLVHEVLQLVDFAVADLDTELSTLIGDRLRWNPWPFETGTLVTGLRAAIETPLGPLFAGKRLRDLPRSERLDELSFELRLGERGRVATDRSIGRLMLSYLPEGDPVRGWAQRLAAGMFDVELAGHLTGSIDLVARVGGGTDGEAPPRFVVVDYKTNTLGERGRLPRSIDYHPDRLPAAMAEHHYPLQALLYSVALHRYLRWRVPTYEPALHLGGAAYLFVRGMSGSGTPVADGSPYGVFSWRVPPALVTALSDLLDGAEALS
ncbi:MAG: UvrD-helicase domain-containing protein [Acidimicrobiales bacterium]|jgi:exodeoxyribonuclease V beta subunit